MSDRVYTFLVSRDGEVESEEIAEEALGLQGARGSVADRVVAAAAADDSRVVRGTTGWTIVTTPMRRSLRDVRYVVVAHASRDDRHALAATSVGFDGRPGRSGGSFAGDERAAASQTLAEIEVLGKRAIPVAFRLPGVRGEINRLSRTWLGRSVLDESEGLCLFRLARRRFPDRSFGSLEAIANALKLPCVSDRGPQEDADLLLGLLELYEDEGVSDLHEITADQYPIRDAVHFLSFAFDAEDLASLPEAPGVYVMRDQEGEVIYVGKSKHLRDRVRTYFADQADRPEKTRKILERIWSVDVDEVGSELEALILEARLIQACHPLFNTQLVVHERPVGYDRASRVILLQPSVDPHSVELFCVEEWGPLLQVRTRVDLTDWPASYDAIDARFFGSTEPLERSEEDVAAYNILQTWMGAIIKRCGKRERATLPFP